MNKIMIENQNFTKEKNVVLFIRYKNFTKHKVPKWQIYS